MITAKLDRARYHIKEASQAIDNYMSTAIRLNYKMSNDKKWRVLYVQEVRDVPLEIPCIVGDALFNLRAFLDHIMMALAEKHCGLENINKKRVYFPMKENKKSFEEWKKINKVAKQLPAGALNTLSELKPYHNEGNKRLRTLSLLNNIDKHRYLMLTAANFQSIRLDGMLTIEDVASTENECGNDIARDMMSLFSKLEVGYQTRQTPIHKNQEFMRYPINETPRDADLKFQFCLFENDIEVKPIQALLKDLDQCAEDIYEKLKEHL